MNLKFYFFLNELFFNIFITLQILFSYKLLLELKYKILPCPFLFLRYLSNKFSKILNHFYVGKYSEIFVIQSFL